MNTSPIRNLLVEKNGQKILRHTILRKIIELLVLLLFFAIAIIAIVIGSIFNEESLFFRISLILLGTVILILFGESFIILMTIRIVLTKTEIKIKKYFKWETISWNEVTTFEIEKRTPRSPKKDPTPRYTKLVIKSSTQEDIFFPLHRFKSKESHFIIETLKDEYKNITKKELTTTNDSIVIDDKPLTEEEIAKHIPPKVEVFEVEDN